MADASRHSPAPPDWSAAFVALPLEAPASSRWPAIAPKIGRKMPRAHRHIRWALAASLFALAALPVAWRWLDARTDAAAPPVAAASATAPRQTSDAAAIDIDTGSTTVAAVASIDPSTVAPVVDTGMRKPVGSASLGHRRPQISPSLPATRRTVAAQVAAAAANAIDESRNRDTASLESLYAASAQLETLLSVARDLRVESGPAAALASTLDAELASIDAQLAQPGLGAQQQQALWQARIETLQASAGFESHLRVLAADGGQLDGMLVSVD